MAQSPKHRKKSRKKWATWPPEWIPFRRARAFVRKLGISGQSEWREYCKGSLRWTKGLKPEGIPATPNGVYWDHWKNWGDWLGTGRSGKGHPKRSFLPFLRARKFVRSLGLRNSVDWSRWNRGEMPEKGTRPADIPAAPWQVYGQKGWVNLGDWLGTGVLSNRCLVFRDFTAARSFARSLGLKGINDWYDYCKNGRPGLPRKPPDIPVIASRTYAGKGWLHWGDWLGTRTYFFRRRKYLPFEETRALARSLGLATREDWCDWVRGDMPKGETSHPEVPASASLVYRGKGWVSWHDFLGSRRVSPNKRSFRPFKEAKALARALRFRNVVEWQTWSRGDMPEKGARPKDVPADPSSVYRGQGWVSWMDFLGTRNRTTSRTPFRPFGEARAFARKLSLNSLKEYKTWSLGGLPAKGTRPPDIPGHPDERYSKEGWAGWADFLGYDQKCRGTRHLLPFQEARTFARALDLKGSLEWSRWKRGEFPAKGARPADIPAHPHIAYRDLGWTSWGDFLGTGFVACNKRCWRPFEEARAFARSLKLKEVREWQLFLTKGRDGLRRPADVPSAPDRCYRGKGWAGWGDFLGTNRSLRSRGPFLPFKEARAFVRGLGLTGFREWKDYCAGRLRGKGRRPSNIPSNPRKIYFNQGWLGFPDFLGYGPVRRHRSRRAVPRRGGKSNLSSEAPQKR